MRALAVRLFVCLVLLFATPSQAATYSHPIDHYTITYPDAWHLDVSGVSKQNNVVIVRNCDRSDLPHGGTLPKGAAEIAIRQFDTDYDEYEFAQRLKKTNDSIVVSPVATPPLRIDESFSVSDEGGGYKRSTVYLRKSGRLIVLELTYGATDPQATAYQDVLDSIISNLP